MLLTDVERANQVEKATQENGHDFNPCAFLRDNWTVHSCLISLFPSSVTAFGLFF